MKKEIGRLAIGICKFVIIAAIAILGTVGLVNYVF